MKTEQAPKELRKLILEVMQDQSRRLDFITVDGIAGDVRRLDPAMVRNVSSQSLRQMVKQLCEQHWGLEAHARRIAAGTEKPFIEKRAGCLNV